MRTPWRVLAGPAFALRLLVVRRLPSDRQCLALAYMTSCSWGVGWEGVPSGPGAGRGVFGLVSASKSLEPELCYMVGPWTSRGSPQHTIADRRS